MMLSRLSMPAQVWLTLFLLLWLGMPSIAADYALQGKVEHVESLPPLQPHLKAGARFKASALPIEGSASVIWWAVPEWLAGSWQNDGKLSRLSLIDLESGRMSEGFASIEINYPDTEIIGYQQDSRGKIWTCVPTPYTGRTEQGSVMNLSIVRSVKPVLVSEKEVVIRFLATTLSVDKKSKKVLTVMQREALQTYRPIEKGRVLLQSSMRFYDEDGKARYESKVLGHCKLKEPYKEMPFIPSNSSQATLIDMRASFDRFLHSKNLDELIPERYPLPPQRGFRIITIN